MRRFGASVLIAAAAVAGLTPVETATAVQANCQTDIPVIGDVDGDGRSDLIVGVPGRSSNTGEVDLRLTTAPSKTLSQQDAGLGQGIPGDEFGAAVVLADLNADGCDDIIVGAPGASNSSGRVHVVLGADDGFQTADGQTLTGGAASGDRFGSSLAIAPNFAGTGFDLWGWRATGQCRQRERCRFGGALLDHQLRGQPGFQPGANHHAEFTRSAWQRRNERPVWSRAVGDFPRCSHW